MRENNQDGTSIVQCVAMNRCALCGASDGWPLQWNDDLSIQQWRSDHGDRRDYSWTLCRDCGNGYPSFQPGLDLLSYYWNRDRQDAIVDFGDNEGAVWNARRAVAQKGASRSFRFFGSQYQKPGRFLDIACGLGETVRYFAERGWEAVGIDADPAVKRFHEQIGIQSKIGQIESSAIDGKFDIIHISHAIYFITNPRQFLESLRNSLSDDGILCIVLANFMAADDQGLPGYPHSFFPTASSMNRLLALGGYETVLHRKKSGSVYLVARAKSVLPPPVFPRLIRLGYRTKRLRYLIFGAPHLAARRLAKTIISLFR